MIRQRSVPPKTHPDASGGRGLSPVVRAHRSELFEKRGVFIAEEHHPALNGKRRRALREMHCLIEHWDKHGCHAPDTAAREDAEAVFLDRQPEGLSD